MPFHTDKGPQTHCIRCGTCCKKGGPALHWGDRLLFKKGVLHIAHVYTLRKGELVRNLDEKLMALDTEIIKIKGQHSAWTCMFFDTQTNACKIYDNRPTECRALKCWDVREFKKTMAQPYLKRADLMDKRDAILQMIDAHEKRCSYQILESVARQLGGPNAQKATDTILDLVERDEFMRPLVSKKLNLSPEVMDFLFGRSLATTIQMFGVRVKKQGNTVFLAPACSRQS